MGSAQSTNENEDGEVSAPLNYNANMPSNAFICVLFENDSSFTDVVASLLVLPQTSYFIMIFPGELKASMPSGFFLKGAVIKNEKFTIISNLELSVDAEKITSDIGPTVYYGTTTNYIAEFFLDDSLQIRSLNNNLFKIIAGSPFQDVSSKWCTSIQKSMQASVNTTALASQYFITHFSPKNFEDAIKHIYTLKERLNVCAIYRLDLLSAIELQYIIQHVPNLQLFAQKIYFINGTLSSNLITFAGVKISPTNASTDVSVSDLGLFTSSILLGGTIKGEYILGTKDTCFEIYKDLGSAKWTTSLSYNLVIAKLTPAEFKILAYLANGFGNKDFIFSIDGVDITLPSIFKTKKVGNTLYIYKYSEDDINVSFDNTSLESVDISFSGSTVKTFIDYSATTRNLCPLIGPSFTMNKVMYIKYEPIRYTIPDGSFVMIYGKDLDYPKSVSILQTLKSNAIVATDKPVTGIQKANVDQQQFNKKYYYSLKSSKVVVTSDGYLTVNMSSQYRLDDDLKLLAENKDNAEISNSGQYYINGDQLNIFNIDEAVQGLPISTSAFLFNHAKKSVPELTSSYINDAASNTPRIIVSFINITNSDTIALCKATLETFYNGGGKNIACVFATGEVITPHNDEFIKLVNGKSLKLFDTIQLGLKSKNTNDTAVLAFNEFSTLDISHVLAVDREAVFRDIPGTTLLCSMTPVTRAVTNTPLYRGAIPTIFNLNGELLDVMHFINNEIKDVTQFACLVTFTGVTNKWIGEFLKQKSAVFKVKTINDNRVLFSTQNMVEFTVGRFSILGNVILDLETSLAENTINITDNVITAQKHKIYVQDLTTSGYQNIKVSRCLLLNAITDTVIAGAGLYFNSIIPVCILPHCEDLELDAILMTLEEAKLPQLLIVSIRNDDKKFTSIRMNDLQHTTFTQLNNLVILFRTYAGTYLDVFLNRNEIHEIWIKSDNKNYFKFGISLTSQTFADITINNIESKHHLDFIINKFTGDRYSDNYKALLNVRVKVQNEFIKINHLDTDIFPVFSQFIKNTNAYVCFLSDLYTTSYPRHQIFDITDPQLTFFEAAVLMKHRMPNISTIILKYDKQTFPPMQSSEQFSFIVNNQSIKFDTADFYRLSDTCWVYGDIVQNEDNVVFKFADSNTQFIFEPDFSSSKYSAKQGVHFATQLPGIEIRFVPNKMVSIKSYILVYNYGSFVIKGFANL